jgi:predicted nucleic acid-binding protein
MAVVRLFLDTSVLLGGLIDVGPSSKPCLALLDRAAGRKDVVGITAWHCCLEFYSVATRLPEEYRLDPGDALALLESEVFGRLEVVGLEPARRLEFLRASAREGVRGGRLYDAHIAEIARRAGSTVVATDNQRHFVMLERHGIRVATAAEALRQLRQPRRRSGARKKK